VRFFQAGCPDCINDNNKKQQNFHVKCQITGGGVSEWVSGVSHPHQHIIIIMIVVFIILFFFLLCFGFWHSGFIVSLITGMFWSELLLIWCLNYIHSISFQSLKFKQKTKYWIKMLAACIWRISFLIKFKLFVTRTGTLTDHKPEPLWRLLNMPQLQFITVHKLQW